VRCVLAAAREFNNAFEWAAHEPEALRVGVPLEIIEAIKLREPIAEMQEPFGTVIELIRGALTAGSVNAETYDAAVALLGVRLLIDLVSLAGMYASTAALLTVFDMQLDAGETHLLSDVALEPRRVGTLGSALTARAAHPRVKAQ
jgi:4-carboxymuconolactone decarboxylase